MISPRKVVLTGATGFLGSNLLANLLTNKYSIHILKRQSSDLKRIEKYLDNIITHDIEEMDDTKLQLLFEGAHSVIHAATCFGRNGETFAEICEANVILPVRLLESAERAKVKLFYNIDTVLPKNLNGYALSKSQFLDWGRLVSLQRTIKFVNIKLDHLYGPGDHSSKFTSYVIKNCLDNISELKFTGGLQKREFIYIDDAITALSVIMRSLESDTIQNEFYINFEVASDLVASTIKEFVELVISITKSRTKPLFGALPYRNNELMENISNGDLLQRLGWLPKVDLASGIKKIIQIEKHSAMPKESLLE